MVRSFLIAWHFLLAVPLHRASCRPAPGELAASMAWFPLVGLAVGGILVGADVLLAPLFAPAVTNGLLLVLLVLLTRALHLDGLADTVDGLVGARTPPERLAIMRDPRVGAMGAVSLVLALGLRYAALVALPVEVRPAFLLTSPVLGRWAMVVAAHAAPSARPEGLGQAFLATRSAAEPWLATGLAALVAGWAFDLSAALAIIAAAGALAFGWAWLCRRWFGGVTGDTLGAINEIVEIAVLVAGPLAVAAR